MADAKAQATWVPRPSARARRYIRYHHRSMEAVRKNPAISHQPPSASGGMLRPYSTPGGSSDSQKSWRTNCTGSQFTEAHMLSPMISIAITPHTIEATPSHPR